MNFSHIRQSEISSVDLTILTNFRHFCHCVHFWNISHQHPQLWYLWTALLKPSVVANWRNKIWITPQDKALNVKDFQWFRNCSSSFFYYYFGKILQFMKILSVEILPSWNVLVVANSGNKDMPMSRKQEAENKKYAYSKLTIRMFHSMETGVFFSLAVSILCRPILLLLSKTRTCAERRQPCA